MQSERESERSEGWSVERSIGQIRAAHDRGDYIVAYDRTQSALERFPKAPELLYWQVRTLTASGSWVRALQLYGESFAPDGTYKEMPVGVLREDLHRKIAMLPAEIERERACVYYQSHGSRAGKSGFSFAEQDPPDAECRRRFARAARQYEQVYLRSEGHQVPGAYAAAMWCLVGEERRARRIAVDVAARCERIGPWREDPALYRGDAESKSARTERENAIAVATAATHSYVVLGTYKRLEAWQSVLVQAVGRSYALLARLRQELQLLSTQVEEPKINEVLGKLQIPSVIHYCGHRFQHTRDKGVSEERQGKIRRRIDEFLQANNVGFGYGGLAAGSDILLAESLLALGAELHIVLPLPSEEYLKTSVVNAGKHWMSRYETCMAQATSISVTSPEWGVRTDASQEGPDDILFSYGGRVAIGRALAKARSLRTQVGQLAVCAPRKKTKKEKENPKLYAAGTWAEVDHWREAVLRQKDVARDTHIIDFKGDRLLREKASNPDRDRELVSLLFADLKGFSQLMERNINDFQEKVMKALSKVIDAAGDKVVLEKNTWGDAIYLVVRSAKKAAKLALRMQRTLGELDFEEMGFREPLKLRIGGHHGPVYKTRDWIRGMKKGAYTGAHVTRAARVEPIALPGEIFVTDAFVAQLSLEDALGKYPCEYVGRAPLAKGYGDNFQLYILRKPDALMDD